MPGEWRTKAKEYKRTDDFKKGKNFKNKKKINNRDNNNNNNNYNNNNYNNNNYNNNNYNYNYNNYENKTLEPLNQNKIIVPIDPNVQNIEQKFDYLETCKKKQEEQEKLGLNLKDPKYWNKNKWIGPVHMKTKKNVGNKYYINKILYSRNGIDWYNSWKETFEKEEYNKMMIQINEERMQKLSDEYIKKMEKYEMKQKMESMMHYNNTGDLDDYALVESWIKKHEDFEKEIENGLENLEEEEYSDDVDSSYDNNSDNDSFN